MQALELIHEHKYMQTFWSIYQRTYIYTATPQRPCKSSWKAREVQRCIYSYVYMCMYVCIYKFYSALQRSHRPGTQLTLSNNQSTFNHLRLLEISFHIHASCHILLSFVWYAVSQIPLYEYCHAFRYAIRYLGGVQKMWSWHNEVWCPCNDSYM